MQNIVIREKQLNVRFNDDEWKLVERFAAHRGVTMAALARSLVLREARDALGPQNEEEFRTAIRNQVAKWEHLHGAPMPPNNMAEWLDTLTFEGRYFTFNAAVQRLEQEGFLARVGGGYATGNGRPKVPQSHLRAAIDAVGLTLARKFRRPEMEKLVHVSGQHRRTFDQRHPPEESRTAEENTLATLEACNVAPKGKATSDQAERAIRDLLAIYVG